MSLLDTLRLGVRIADKVTKPLQPNVTFSHYTGSNEFGDKTYTAPVPLRAIIDWKQKQLRTQGGVLSVSRASVLFLDIDKLKAATNNEGVDDNDLVVLPDGTTGPILDMGGFIDAGTGIPLATEIFLG